MDDHEEDLRISFECRQIIREPIYSPQLSAQLIEWLKRPGAAVSDIAGRALMKLGEPAFEDVFALATQSGELPWPNAVWVLGGINFGTERLMPYLRTWIHAGSNELKKQSVVTLAGILIDRKRSGIPPDPTDVALCDEILMHYFTSAGECGVHLRDFRKGMRES
jgi:hypothetical protein